MSEIKVNKISPRTNCGTVQLGDSGDTFTIPAGATITNNGTQTGFGREGSVNWDTTAKTAGFTGVSGNGYFINTTAGTITVNLPASPSAGDIMAIKDYTGTFATNACTVGRNSSNIRGAASDFLFNINNSGAVFIYVDATEGWQVFVDGSNGDATLSFITASGGTETTCGDFKIHTFTGPGTFTVSGVSNCIATNLVDYMVVAGGGGGAGRYASGAGGAGGYRESKVTATSGCWTASPLAETSSLPVSALAYPITVGGGGAGGTPGSPCGPVNNGQNGSNSVFSTITSAGGGGGGSRGCTPGSPNGYPGSPGGSGGGAGYAQCGGSGNTPPVSPPQGNDGGGNPSSQYGSGGGGALAVGATSGSAPSPAGNGGAGASNSITGSSVTRAGGGGGGSDLPAGGTGGAGGGGNGGAAATIGDAGTVNTGGGAGGSGGTGSAPSAQGSSGGSGIVIIRYKFQ